MGENKKIRFIDLFAGLGGLRIGFEQALRLCGFDGETVFSSEIKAHAVDAYHNNFNEKVHGDITKVNENIIPDFDFLLAGFPCQAFSNAGRRLGFEDTRGTLFFDVARIINAKQPAGFLLENVEGLLTHDNGKTFKTMINTLNDLGYENSFSVLDGKDFGLAQSRRRIYICGTKNGKKISFDNFPQKQGYIKDIIDTDIGPVDTKFTQKLLSHFKLSEIVGKQIKDKRGGNNNIHSWDFELKGKVSPEQKKLLALMLKQRRNKKWANIHKIDWMDGMPLTIEMIKTFYWSENLEEMLHDLVKKKYLVFEHPKKIVEKRRVYDTTAEKGYNIVTGKLSFEFNKILDPYEIAPALVATDVSRLAVPVQNGIRPLTVREGLRLFGFPENYSIDGIPLKEAFDLLGNTVCIPVIKEVAIRLIYAALN